MHAMPCTAPIVKEYPLISSPTEDESKQFERDENIQKVEDFIKFNDSKSPKKFNSKDVQSSLQIMLGKKPQVQLLRFLKTE